MKSAGDNRAELEKVLQHYSHTPADSLKRRSAEFLIANMPGKYSKYYDAPWNDVATVCLRWTSSSDKQKVLDTYKLGNLIVENDVEYITAAYLINNIDLAFKVWKEQPWGKHIPFDIFCEEILPYRVGSEPLENWREKVLASFADVNRSFQNGPNTTAVEACRRVNKLLPHFTMDPDFPQMSYSMLMASCKGTCDEMVALTIFAMRGLGIPVTKDYTPKWPYRVVGHSWNSVCDSSGRHISFMGTERAPGDPHIGTENTKSKVYRCRFANQKLLNTEDENIPLKLQNLNMMDVSSEYKGYKDIEIPITIPPAVNTGYAYLTELDGQQWQAVGWGIANEQCIKYASIGKDIVYLPIFYVNGVQTAAHSPFYIDKTGTVYFYHADTTKLQILSLREAYSVSDKGLYKRMQNGRFEGGNRPDFSDAKLLYTITDLPEGALNKVKLKNSLPCRYVRYVSPVEGFGNIAEMRFYTTNNQQLSGTAIGTAGDFYGNSSSTFDKAFDDDLSTFFDALQSSGAWTGLDLGKTYPISEIHYYPRQIGNEISTNRYELFYWQGNDWKSLGQQQGNDYELHYTVPSNALFYLKDMSTTGGNTKHVFTVSEGKIKWF
ncbi:hypothetical protein FACS1894199_06040 [Bacteroidia bacterium]|nr:hypothetical protein FACS1894199_06040 [Bacteroidia bacterium]